MLLMVVCLLPVGTTLKGWLLRHGLVDRKSPELIVVRRGRWTLSVILWWRSSRSSTHAGPGMKHRFHVLTPGDGLLPDRVDRARRAFRLYVDRVGGAGYAKTYGTVGGVAILLLFFYIDALVLLIGAEINSEIDFEVLQDPPRHPRLPRGRRRRHRPRPAHVALTKGRRAGSQPRPHPFPSSKCCFPPVRAFVPPSLRAFPLLLHLDLPDPPLALPGWSGSRSICPRGSQAGLSSQLPLRVT